MSAEPGTPESCASLADTTLSQTLILKFGLTGPWGYSGGGEGALCKLAVEEQAANNTRLEEETRGQGF